MATTDTNQEIFQWYVMRDLKRPNAKLPAYKMLKEMGLEVFTPMVRKTITRKGEKIYSEKPFIPDLLFIRNSRKNLDPIVNNTTTLQYRFLSDGKRTPMTVNSKEMELFIKVAKEVNNLRYYAPTEIKANMIGKLVRIVGGVLDGYVGNLQKLQGSKNKRLFIELPNVLTASVEVESEYIQLLEK